MRSLRLHRTRFYQAYSDERYAFAKDRCLLDAKTLLDLGELWVNSSTRVADRWWPVAFGYYTAGVIFFVDYSRTRNQHHREEVHRACRLLRYVAIGLAAPDCECETLLMTPPH